MQHCLLPGLFDKFSLTCFLKKNNISFKLEVPFCYISKHVLFYDNQLIWFLMLFAVVIRKSFLIMYVPRIRLRVKFSRILGYRPGDEVYF